MLTSCRIESHNKPLTSDFSAENVLMSMSFVKKLRTLSSFITFFPNSGSEEPQISQTGEILPAKQGLNFSSGLSRQTVVYLVFRFSRRPHPTAGYFEQHSLFFCAPL